MAPPLGLTVSGSGFSSFSQDSTTEAKASLISVTWMSDIDRPVRASRCWVASMGPVSIRIGIAADEAGVDDAGPRPQPEGLGLAPLHEQHGAGAVGDLRRRAGGVTSALGTDDRIAGLHDGLQPGERLERRLPQALVLGDVVGRPGGLAVVAEVGCVDLDELALEAALRPRHRGAVL